MTQTLKIFILIAMCTLAGHIVSIAQEMPKSFMDSIKSTTQMVDGEYFVKYGKYDYLVDIQKQRVQHIRIPLFSDDMRSNFNDRLLKYIEEACADQILKLNDQRFSEVTFSEGSWTTIMSYPEDISFSLQSQNDALYQAIWEKDGKTSKLNFPYGYDKANKGSRAEIEDRFIEGLKEYSAINNREVPKPSVDNLKEVGDSLYVLEGDIYVIDNVNRNAYFSLDDGEALEVMSAELPLPSFANMVILGNGYEADIELRVSKHEYGEFEILTIPLECLIQYGESLGCKVYWGVEHCEPELIKGTIFLYNQIEGYDHIIRVEFNPNDIDKDGFLVKGRASLYVPTNNVQNLFQEYKAKKENEKIKY